MRIVTAAQMREMDRLTIESFGIPGRVLMETAGRGAARAFMERFPKPARENSAGVLAGRGNNGGDGFVIARLLHEWGVETSVCLLSEKKRVKGEAADNLALLEPLGVEVLEAPDPAAFASVKDRLGRHTVFIDAMLGTGLSSDVRGLFEEAIAFVNSLKRPVFSVDIPSGLDSDTGRPRGACVRARATATFAFPKIGHILWPGADFCGKLEVVDIGIPRHIAALVKPDTRLTDPARIRSFFSPKGADIHKGDNGHVLALAGSPGKTGAAAMTGVSAMRAGAGLVTIAAPRGVSGVLETLSMETMTHPLPESENGRLGMAAFDEIKALLLEKNVLAMGPGLGADPGVRRLVRRLAAECPIPMVIDADALNCLAGDVSILRQSAGPVILTPHPGEMARLIQSTTADVQNDRLGHARALAADTGAHVVLKGAKTIVAGPNGRALINPTGNPGMASGGMGDVLTGVLAGLLSQGLSPGDAAAAAVYIHGDAADRLAEKKGAFGFLAGEVMEEIPGRLDALLHPRGRRRENRRVFQKRR
ncbi:ADP-dependent (S)-NAD(P)H-hydrate dehydratase / NAD(P)H-hydrate epimerase [Candidatus Desulfarcum epimagneticum]|uniref:Bifunctional NAD(P)H-hydrate repair enzyme n=1 Tax=uncultured Desulfobacteraceae bacterium TaxID=218296 RepID=A0A484HJQ8_9BACT|nr:ADP-dependent (S)-NAD(P)H-hydrate dehydratase / NAD(P)H-hydrate epimerase [uncultured Desulfobacteraceae bacterium]